MKNLFVVICRLLPVALLLCTFNGIVSAQVPTKFLRSASELDQHLPWLFSEAPTARMAQVPQKTDAHFAAYVEEAPALGTPQPLMLKKEDGTFYDFDTYTVWKLPVVALGAESINLILADVDLPERSQLVVYSRESAMYHGPVTAKDLVAGNYFCDMIIGDNATIEVVMPITAKAEFQITLPGYLFGTTDKAGLLRNGEVVAGNKK